jgi:D-glycero-D-manno-heptose 1,7-bisphosphate phosphatase
VFIDKDGTLVVNVPYNADPAQLCWQPGACEALAALAGAGYALVIVTNQSGIGLGRFTEAQFLRLRQRLAQRLQREAGVSLAGFWHCPHAPHPDGRPSCGCRKPSPLMLQRAARAHGLDLARSWMVGDTLDDIEAGRRAGCRTLLYDSGGETVWQLSPQREPHARTAHWHHVARTILEPSRVDA